MGTKLISMFLSRGEKNRGQALKAYAALLESDSTKPEDADALKETVDLLGKTPDQVYADAEAIKLARELLATVKKGVGLDSGVENAREAIRELKEERERVLRELDNRHQALQQKYSELHNLQVNAKASRLRFEELRHKHPEALGHIPVPDPID
ncbi:hypothetical protein [Humisphaera borealis]|uniref:Uncharacterized protein n=1 Tax=Humisphaera borealis TaxID=2807512 RepID=A0A7M2WVC4_9BACT|nr:hypothetical protein [Humisphaera borealis]QOV88440.1 hypothetical protein IPV69_19620 [Humisphaera borealis]